MVKNFYSTAFDRNMVRAYSQVCDAIRSYKRNTTVYTHFNEDEIRRICLAVLFENPDFVHCCVNSIPSSVNSLGTTFNFSYNDNVDISLFEDEIGKAVDELSRKIKDQMTEWEKAKIIYDYIVTNVRYDWDAQSEYVNGMRCRRAQEMEHYNAFTAYGAIVDKKAVCLGLSHLYSLLLDKFYVNSCVVTVTDLNGNPHAINVVEVDGNRAYADVTYGMSLRDTSDNLLMVSYDVFMLDDEDIKKYYTLDITCDCDTKSQGYYQKKNLVFSDAQKLRQYLYSYTYHKSGGEIRCLYTGSLDDRYIERILRSAMIKICGNTYEVADGYVNHGAINCKINIRGK